MKLDIKSLLQFAVDKDASDLHLQTNSPPMLRIDSELVAIPETIVLTKETAKLLVLSLMTQQQQEIYIQNKEIDFSVSLSDKARFRVNAYHQKNSMAAALRLIPSKIKTIDELNLPEIFYDFAKLNSGLILISGPTGHGKSTTLAAIIDEINRQRACNIITIEDPIEYVYENRKAIVSQREIGHDTDSWKNALKSILREDPDVVLVGEMRDYETISAALTIAETGHLVFATLHTNSAAQSVDRIVDSFPAHQQNQVKMQLANVLQAIVSQRLLPTTAGGRVPAVEIMRGTSAIKTNIREGKTHLIDNIIQTSKEDGMNTLEESLADLVNKGIIDFEVAQKWTMHPEELSRKIKGSS